MLKFVQFPQISRSMKCSTYTYIGVAAILCGIDLIMSSKGLEEYSDLAESDDSSSDSGDSSSNASVPTLDSDDSNSVICALYPHVSKTEIVKRIFWKFNKSFINSLLWPCNLVKITYSTLINTIKVRDNRTKFAEVCKQLS